MVPIAPSMTRMRSRSAASSRATRSGWSQGRVCMTGLVRQWRSGLAGDHRDHLEMRRPLLAGHRLGVQKFQAGARDEAAQVLLAEAEVGVAVGLHHALVLM